MSRPERTGTHRTVYESNKKKILKMQSQCGICGGLVDKSLKYPNPLSACIDHIIPIAKGGHPSDIDNLQLAHWTCNRQKSDKLFINSDSGVVNEVVTNRNLPQSINWITYRAEK